MSADPDPRAWYALAGPGHAWMRWRLEAFLHSARERAVPLDSPLRALDARCRNGALRAQLEAATPWTVDGMEEDPEALPFNPPTRGRLLLGRALDDPGKEDRGVYDAAFLFDCLEHEPDDGAALRAAARRVRPGGWLFVNVPAFEFLRGGYDRLSGHLRRYDRNSLGRLLGEAGLREPTAAYWGAPLLPLVAAREALAWAWSGPEAAERGFPAVGSRGERLIALLAALEGAYARRPPAGASLLAIARNP
jgi:SAM-dependent methyltransferase